MTSGMDEGKNGVRQITFDLENAADTDRLGALLASTLPDSAVVALTGTLGAGKTRLVRGLACAEGVVDEDVQSPTFVLCHQYPGRRTIYHLDAYRVDDADAFFDLGVEEFYDAGGLTLIEWADRVVEALPDERLELHLDITGPESRHVTARARGTLYQPVLHHLAHTFATRS